MPREQSTWKVRWKLRCSREELLHTAEGEERVRAVVHRLCIAAQCSEGSC